RPAFDTYRIAIRLLGEVTAAELERWDEVGQIRLVQAGQTTRVLFSRLPGPQEASVPATAASADLDDMWGKRETIEARGGFFRVEPPGALCGQSIADYCMIGRTTYYLIQENGGQGATAGGTLPVESDTADEAARETTRPATRISPTPRPSATAAPTRTPQPTASAEPTPAETAAPTSTAIVADTAIPPETNDPQGPD